MPCSDGGPCDPGPSNWRKLQQRDAMLCAVLTELERRSPTLGHYLDPIDWNEAGVSRADLESWWKEHKAQDRARRSKEEQQRREEALRDQALKKLTGDELRALRKLGLPGPPRR